MGNSRMRVLLVAEAVTLAHVGRTLTLAHALHARGIELALALCGAKGAWPTPFPQVALDGIGPEAFGRALAAGRPVLDLARLGDMVADDAGLLRRFEPDLVIGDFRLSLAVSARVARIPYATLTNAYWSPACSLPMDLPVLPLSRALPLPLARALFEMGKGFALAMHCRPMNRMRAEHGMGSLGGDLRAVYSDADWVLLADLSGMFPMTDLPANHIYLGPVSWSPDVSLPAWWNGLDTERPTIYVNVGSSGDPRVLRMIVEALVPTGHTLLVSTAGSGALDDLRAPHVHLARYLPGDKAAARARLVVCNGGSMGCQQAFAADRPVLGVCSNMDQFLNMAAVEAAGAGLTMRADRVSADSVRRVVGRLLDDNSFAASAARLGERIRASDAGQVLFDLLPRLAGQRRHADQRPAPTGAAISPSR
jgi:UDP:flavonoid glycosyltransferase YjiC (YdhE family)